MDTPFGGEIFDCLLPASVSGDITDYRTDPWLLVVNRNPTHKAHDLVLCQKRHEASAEKAAAASHEHAHGYQFRPRDPGSKSG
tara:strand:+ start:364 stop:612 length:249 start_codon:yes stop_codon:yes gene_type:complete